ncbi:MAG: XRE family transcriptional regulator [Micrococcales bacterium]|nr:XRE family transcriptional regulator [Micrococcales bacterium]
MLTVMTATASRIADKIRGVAAEKRFTQKRIAQTLGIAQSSVTERLAGRVPFTAPEVLTLAAAMGEPVERFFPSPAAAPAPTGERVA